MKTNRKTKSMILIILGIYFFFLPIITTNLGFTAIEPNFDPDNLKSSTISGKIHINNNSGWLDFRNAGNCTGYGTYSEPYIIEDLIINGGGLGGGILIENSNVYFKIENCTVFSPGGYSGIKFSNISNGKLIDNNFSSNDNGIELSNSHNNTISGNIVNYNYHYGIKLSYSYNNTISDNAVINNSVIGIVLADECHNNIILGNLVLGNNASNSFPKDGIVLINSEYNTITGNTVKYHDSKGVALDHSNNNIVSGNNVNINIMGIILTYSDYCTLSENIIKNNHNGMILSHSDNNIISRNILIGNDECIVEENSQGNNFENNDCGVEDRAIPGYDLFFLLGIILVFLFTISKNIKLHRIEKNL